MSLDDDMRVLARVSLFEAFSREQLRLLAFGAERITLRAGRTLYWEGAPADCAFVVASGSVVLFSGEEGERHVLGQMGPGSILGEFALIAEGRRLTHAAAETDVQLIRLNRGMFRRILEEYPETAMALRQRVAENLRLMIARLEKVASRLAE